MIFFWMRHFFILHPPAIPTEFMEAGMISTIYALMGILVWFLVHQLKQGRSRVCEILIQLESTRERLISEEKLAAIGRLAGNIAHEIRNPVAMISSSLATAADPNVADADREEMLLIATKEAGRLELLTSEFLNYARPSIPRRSTVLVSDLLSYIADVVKAHAAKNEIEVVHHSADNLAIEADSTQIQGALLNLVLNGIDAASSKGSIALEASKLGTFVRIDVQNSGIPISQSDLPRIFEPFYSTKAAGTGLGLPIARGVAQAHGGDLWVSCNESGRVVFSMTIADFRPEERQKE
jgi:two-component system sensor histidine kinase HydH